MPENKCNEKFNFFYSHTSFTEMTRAIQVPERRPRTLHSSLFTPNNFWASWSPETAPREYLTEIYNREDYACKNTF